MLVVELSVIQCISGSIYQGHCISRSQFGIHRVSPGITLTTGPFQSVSPFLTYLFSQNRQELNIFKRPLHQWQEQGAMVLQSCEKVNMSMAGLRCISLVKTGDQDLGAY